MSASPMSRSEILLDGRLAFLLDSLSRRSFKSLPHGVGLKTAVKARELGFVEWSGDLREFTLKLTLLGYRSRSARPPI